MDISFIILTWNSEKVIGACLQALIREVERCGLRYQILLVDNGSKDRSVPMIEAYHAGFAETIKPIFLPRNMGTTYSRNLGIQRASGDYLCIMDSDVEVSKAMIPALIQAMVQNPRAGLIAPRLVYADGTLQKSTDEFPTLPNKIKRYLLLKRIEKREDRETRAKGIFPVPYAISAFWMLRRSSLLRVGPLDEKIFYAPEDVDYCYRMWRAGYQVLYHADVTAVHHTQEISRGFKVNLATVHHVRGLLYYFKKHHYCLKAKPVGIETQFGGTIH